MKINWQTIEREPATGRVMRVGHFAGYGSQTAYFAHVPAAHPFTVELLLAEDVAGTLWRKLRKPDGTWSNAAQIGSQGDIRHYATA